MEHKAHSHGKGFSWESWPCCMKELFWGLGNVHARTRGQRYLHKAASHWLSKFGSPKLEAVFENMSLSGKFYTVHKQRAIFVSL